MDDPERKFDERILQAPVSVPQPRAPIVDKSVVPKGLITAGDVIAYFVCFFPKSALNRPGFPRANYARERKRA
jgi:hypothetical protein